MHRCINQNLTSDYLSDVLQWKDSWPKRIGLFLAGRISSELLLKDSIQASTLPERNGQKCEALYFIGMVGISVGDDKSALEALQKCIDMKQVQVAEYSLATMRIHHLHH